MIRTADQSEDPGADEGRPADSPLHRVGGRVADALALQPDDIAAIAPARRLPSWRSTLRVAELAYDSAALSSLAMALVGSDRGVSTPGMRSIRVDASRVQASFGSERLFRIDGSAPRFRAPLSDFWRVSDGWVRTHGNYPHHVERLTALLGLPARAGRAAVGAAMRDRGRFELEDRAARAGALIIAVRDPSEWRSHPQFSVLERSPAVHLESRGNAAPRRWREAGGLPLTGIRVLDLTRVIAGPVATRDLATAGADVLRIDSPRLPEVAWQHLDTGQAKRSTLLDLDRSADLDRVRQLLESADVVVHGYRPSALSKYGLDFEALHRRFPGIVVAQLSAWGAEGPWGRRRGFDSLVQAASGIAVLESTDGGTTPGALPVQALDHSAGHFLAASIATALLRQRREGGSFGIRVSLARIANELLAAGPAPHAADAAASVDQELALPTTSVPVGTASGGATSRVECAPPILAFDGAPTEYRSPLHRWGADPPVWRTTG